MLKIKVLPGKANLLKSGLAALGLLFAAGPLLHAQQAEATASAFVYFDVTGAGTTAGTGTMASSMNASGEIAGVYVDAKGVFHGYLRNAAGKVTTFDPGGSSTSSTHGTVASSINASGLITGFWGDAQSISHGFLRSADGKTVTAVNETCAALGSGQGSISGTAQGTTVQGINAAGTVTGWCKDSSFVYQGFVLPAGGTATLFHVKAAGTGVHQGTEPAGINATGVIVGRYIDTGLVSHGFVRAVNGTITEFDVKAAGAGQYQGTYPIAIDAAGDVTGFYVDADGAHHGFVRRVSAVSGSSRGITSFDGPNAETSSCPATLEGTVLCGTAGLSINTAGTVVGGYVDVSGTVHGLMLTAKGILTQIDAPVAGNGSYQGTVATAINDAGVIAGSYIDTKTAGHGFIYTPGTQALAATTTTLGSSPHPSVFAQPVTFTAKVTSSGGTPPDGDSVTFLNGAAKMGTAKLSAGSASFTTTALPVGSDSATAVYAGDTSYATSTSKAFIQKVGKAASTTKLTASSASVTYGQKVTLTATVAGQYGGTATGTVTFKIGSTELGDASLASGKAKLTTPYLPAGVDSIIASYSGDSNFAASKSAALSVTVSKAVLTVTAANQTAVYNQSLPELSYTVAGYLNADSFWAISGSPLETTTAKQGSAAGSYPITITQGTLSSSDYSFKFVNGALKIYAKGTAAPTFSPQAGSSTTAVSVSISDATAGAVIYYTTDGSMPTVKSTKYTAAIPISVTGTLLAIAVAPGYAASPVSSATYTIGGSQVTVTLSTSNTNPTQGKSITLTATESMTGSAEANYWQYSIYDGGTIILQGASSNVITQTGTEFVYQTSSLGVGTHILWAACKAAFGGEMGVSAPFTVTVKAAK